MVRIRLVTGPLTTPIRKPQILSLASALLAGACLARPVITHAAQVPRIHPKKIELLQGVVTGARAVPAYAAALAASTDQMGEIYCDDNNANFAKIKNSSIFRVETGSRYFDLSKLCTNDTLGFDRYGRGRGLYTWDHWQQLHVGEKVVLRIVKQRAQLSIPRCQDLGLLSEAQARRAFDPLSGGSKAYRSHCIYGVMEAYVQVKRPDVRFWTFRVVDSGPRSQTKSERIGADYSASLPPPW